jgi:hypothetical protein
MASGTDGNIISYDTSGNPVAVATGTDGQVLTSSGAGTVCAFEDAGGGGGLIFVGTAIASSSATITVTGLDSTYDTYLITGSDLHPATDSANPWIRFGDSSGIDSGASDYTWICNGNNIPTSSLTRIVSTGDANLALNGDRAEEWGNQADEGGGFALWLHQPGDATTEPNASWQYTAVGFSGAGGHISTGTGGGRRMAVITLDRIQFLFSSGDIASGRLTVHGVTNS